MDVVIPDQIYLGFQSFSFENCVGFSTKKVSYFFKKKSTTACKSIQKIILCVLCITDLFCPYFYANYVNIFLLNKVQFVVCRSAFCPVIYNGH